MKLLNFIQKGKVRAFTKKIYWLSGKRKAENSRRFILFTFLSSLLPAFLFSQWLETTIYLPDSLSGVIDGRAFAYNATNNIIYVGGASGYAVVAIDGQTDEKIARIPAGSDIYALCWNSTNNRVYSANLGDDNITVIDGETHSVITTIPVGNAPRDLVYNSTNNKVYCANRDSKNVTVIDGATNNVITTIPVPNFVSDLLYNPTNNKVYCAGSNYIYNDTITVIDGAGDSVIKKIRVGRRPRALVYNPLNNKVYCANNYDNTVSVINGATNNVIATISVGSGPLYLVYNPTNNKVYCANASSDNITVIDGATNSVITTISVGDYPQTLVYNSTNNKVYCGCFDSIWVIDGASNNVIATIPLSGSSYSLLYNPTNNKIYDACTRGRVAVIDGAEDSIITTIIVGSPPYALTYNSLGNKIYSAGIWTSDVCVIDGATNGVIKRIPLDFYYCPDGIVYCPVNNTIYLHGFMSSLILSIDGLADSVVGGVLVTAECFGDFLFNPTNNNLYYSGSTIGSDGNAFLYTIVPNCRELFEIIIPSTGGPLVSNSIDNKVYWGISYGEDGLGYLLVIDGATNNLITSIYLGENPPCALVYNSRNNKVYCGIWNSGEIKVIDGTANNIIATIPVVGRPCYLAYNSRNNKVYCGDENGDEPIVVIDGAGDSVITTIGTRSGPLFYNPIDNKVYCVTSPNALIVIDGAGDTIITTIPVGHGPWAFAWNPVQNRLYVANYNSSSISVIRDEMTEVEEAKNSKFLVQNLELKVSPTLSKNGFRISYTIGLDAEDAGFKIYDATGRLVKDFSRFTNYAGHSTSIVWDGTDDSGRKVPAGVYFVHLTVDEFRQIEKAILLK